MRIGIFGQQMVMHVEAFGMKTTEQASKYSKEEWWVSIRVGWFDSLLEDAMERIGTRAPAARKCNGVGLQGTLHRPNEPSGSPNHMTFAANQRETLISTNQMRADVRAPGRNQNFTGIN
jgi:hypothetical protein